MHLDIGQVSSFYTTTGLGGIVKRVLRDQIVGLWPDTRGQTVAGFGFPTPVLRPFLASSRRVLGLMPAQQGVMAWPRSGDDGENRSVLVDETRWPIATGTIDRLIVMHGLETCDNPTGLIDEIWRTLGPGGRAVFVVPNRSGLWARRDVTPFGFGRPYSLMQLESLLQDHQFTPERHISALYMLPSHRPFWLRTARYWERLNNRLPVPLAAGVLIVEVSKRHQPHAVRGIRDAVRSPLEALDGMIRPAKDSVSGRSRRQLDDRK